MRLLVGFAAICLVLGCADAGVESSAAARLSGHWMTMDSTTVCWYAFSFREDGLIESKELCELRDGSLAIVVDAGRFEATDESFTWEVRESSCAYESTWPVTVRYTLQGDKLTLFTPEGALILKRLDESGGGEGGAFTFGCFDDQGVFQPRPILPI
jgi:hypothetical protein